MKLREGEAPQGEYPRGAWAPIRKPVNGMNEERGIPRFGADETDQDTPARRPYYVSFGVTDEMVATGEDFGRYGDFPNLRREVASGDDWGRYDFPNLRGDR